MIKQFINRENLHLVATVLGQPQERNIIFLHGGGQTRHSWQRSLEVFARQGYSVMSLDARGHGESSWSPEAKYDLNELSLDLLEIIEHLPKPPVLVGASMGGLTAINCLTLSHKAIMHGLVLVDVVPQINANGADSILSFLNQHTNGFSSLEEAADIISQYNPYRNRPKRLHGLMKNLRQRPDGRLYWHWDPDFFKCSDLRHYGQLENRLKQACTTIDFPTMLIRGEKSNVVTDTGVDNLRECIPQLQVFEVQKAGHMITGDHNDIFNKGIEQFMADLDWQ